MLSIGVEELKNVQLDILKHVDSFCREHHIRYFMSYGSLIGAIRHKGFIPWDDDIDIMMLRPDYERFIKIYSEIDKSDYNIYSTRLDKQFPFPYTKVDNSKTLLIEHVEKSIPIGVNIDIFPIDNIPSSNNKQKEMYDYYKKQMILLGLKQISINKRRVFYKNCLLFISHIILKPLPLSSIVMRIERNAMKYKDEKSLFCGVAVWGYGMREINLRSNWDEVLYVPFEDMIVPAPKGYDNYLRGIYGDYMQLPPVEKRVSHHSFKAYWK